MTDIDLIQRYLNQGDEGAFEQLLARYLELSKGIVRKHCRSTLDHEDLVQQSWIKIIQSLSRYDDRQKFGAFVATITRNTVKDYWRYQNVRSETEFFTDVGSEEQIVDFSDESVDVGQQLDIEKQINALMSEYIPELPVELRVVFLLKHEAEYWEGKKRLDWNQLGILTAQSELETWNRFDAVRRFYAAIADRTGDEAATVTLLDQEVFLLWTQAQRPVIAKKVTENELSELLGIPVNTFKTRYRAAKKRLSEMLSRSQERAVAV